MQYDKLFRTQSVWKSIFSMAIPSVVTILVMIVYNIADMFFIGQLGDTGKIAAVSVVSPLFSFAAAIGSMIGGGGSALIARELGADNIRSAKRYSSLCFWGSLLLGGILAALIVAANGPILRFLGAEETFAQDARLYIIICGAGVPFMLISSSLGTIVRSEGAIREGLIGNLTGNFVNLVLDPLFILAFRMGVAGAALATVFGNVVASLFYMYYVLRKAQALTIKPEFAMEKPSLLLSVMALGMPNALSTILASFASTFSNRMLRGYGTDAIAAMGAAGKTTMVIGMLQIGICMGVQPLLAYNYGAKDTLRLKETVKKLTILTVSVGTAAGLGCLAAREVLIGLFLKEPSAAELGVRLVLYLVIASPLIGLYNLGSNFMQASGNAFAATVVSVLRQGILLIPLLYILNTLLGFTGIALAHTVADVAASLISVALILWQFQKMKKEMTGEQI